MRILIAGLGSIGRRHLRNLVTLGEASEVFLLRSGQRYEEFANPTVSGLSEELLENFRSVNEIKDALNWRPDAVIVSNPTALHLDIAIPAAKAGCHLFIEKPVSHSLQRVDQLQKAVRQGGGMIMVGYQFRFHPGIQKIAQLLRQNAIGQPLSFRAQWSEWLPGWHPWEDHRKGYSARQDLGGGVILTLSHPLDYLVWLFGEIDAVWAFTGKNHELHTEVEDTAEIGVRFKNDTFGSVHLDYNGQPSAHRLEIIGVGGTITWDYASGTVELFKGVNINSKNKLVPNDTKKEKGSQAVNQEWIQFPASHGFERNEMFLAEMRYFLAMVRQEFRNQSDPIPLMTPACGLDDGIYVLKICQAALLASQTGNLQRII